MHTHADKTQENKSQSVSAANPQLQSGGESTFQFVDNRPEAVKQRKLQEMANKSPQVKLATQLQAMANHYSVQQHQPIQKKENNTGFPDNLKTGIENLSGYSMDDVKVHYNSDKPFQLQAHAYAQGSDIHLGSGQEKHLPHEAWHVVQHKQGRVKPTMQLKDKVNVNDDAGLEKEADVMGAKANSLSFQLSADNRKDNHLDFNKLGTFQRVIIQGADADETSDVALSGYGRLISQSEIQNTNEFLREEDRAGGKRTFSIDSLDGITFDEMNYLNGHFQDGQGYFGLSANVLAKTLRDAGLSSGQNIILTGCESAGYATLLAVSLHELGVDVTVTGAQGIAFDYKSQNGDVIEAMYDSGQISDDANRQHNLQNKLAVAHKFEQIFINEITSTIFNVGTILEQEEFFNYFYNLGKSKIKYVENSDLTDERIGELTTAKNVFQGLIGQANGPDFVLDNEPTIDQLVAFSTDDNRPVFSRAQLISFKNTLNGLIPGERNVGNSADELRTQTSNGHFIFKEYTSRDQLWIRNFMHAVKKANDSLVKKFVLKKYVEIGRKAANEYVKTMVEGYNADANDARLENGWVSFTHEGQSGTHATFRKMADL